MGSIADQLQLTGLVISGAHLEGQRIIWEVRLRAAGRPACPRCGYAKPWRHGIRKRRAAHLPVGMRPCDMELALRRYRCPKCRHTFSLPVPGLAPRSRISDALREFVNWAVVKLGSTILDLSRWLKLGWNALWRCLVPAPSPDLDQLRDLCLDEVYYRDPRKYLTVLSDAQSGCVLGLAEGRGFAPSRRLLLELPSGVRDAVETLATDLNSGQRKAAYQCLPHAEVAADCFHIVRLARKCVREASAMQLERTRRAVRQLRVVLDRGTDEQFRAWLERWQGSPGSLGTLQQTLDQWALEVESYLNTGRSTGPAEALNRKIALLRRKACGYTNLNNFKRRILLLNSSLHH